jgi:uncharacterized protein (TIGR02302 family)
LTDKPTQGSEGSENTVVSSQREVDRLLARGISRARWSILWERVWPPLAAFLTVCGLFFALSWLGLWIWLPPLARAIGVVIFGLLALAALAPLALVRWPSVAEGLRRLDQRSGLPHRPAVTMTDKLAAHDSDAMTQALWRVHIERALASARKLKSGWPMPQLPTRDPMAIRALVLVACVATFFAAGGDRERRVAAAFNWHGVVTPANYRVDAWVAPPQYTQRPPVILPGLRPGETQRASGPVTVPANSVLVIRSSGATGLDVVLKGGIKADENAEAASQQPAAPGTEEHRYVIADKGEVTLRGIGSPVTWSFVAVPDQAPTIALTKDPEPQARGSLMLNYKVEDDYGVTEARALFTLKPQQFDAFGVKVGGFRAPRPLFEAPDMPLVLPQARTRSGVGQTLRDLSGHPWAGAEVIMTLVARDDGGNEGRSEPFEMVLPERLFTKPMARALIEQRRILALDAEAKPQVQTALDALAMAPEVFQIEASVYLGLRSIYWQLNRAKTDDALREVVARLWDMATRIEDGNISEVEQALRAAQDALREALERGASDEEIKKLTDELRAALDKFLQALAEEMRKNPQQMARPLDPNTRQLRPQDLKSMLDRIEQLARSGAKDAAQRLLQELQQMLENLQMARPGQQGDQDSDDMMSALDDLGNMIREQQQLRDRTFRQGQDQRRERQRGQQGQNQNRQGMGELRQNQQALREQLQKLLEQLRQRGMDQQGEQGQSGMDQLGKAGEAMEQAEGELGDGDADGAVSSQGRALEALRRGAQGMAQAMQQPGMGPGGPGQPGRAAPSRAQQETDPLGRPLRHGRDYSDDQSVRVPGEIDVQRARRILDELRRRFADPARPQIELDYIERLLKDF